MRKYQFSNQTAKRAAQKFRDLDEALRFLRQAATTPDTLGDLRALGYENGLNARSDKDLLSALAKQLHDGQISVGARADRNWTEDNGAPETPKKDWPRPKPKPPGGGDKPKPKPKDGPKPTPKPKDKPVCPTSVDIDAKCHILMVGEAKTFKAVDPDGTSSGSYQWTTSGGGVTLSNATSPTVTVTAGAAASSAYEGETLKVTRSQAGCPDVSKEIKLTVFKFEKIKITIDPTPPNTVRAGFAAPAKHDLEITSNSKSFTTNLPVVLVKCTNREAELELTAAPAGLPIHWHTERNPSDHASLGAAGDLPTVTPGSPVTKATLKADEKGSFHIRPFVSCKGDATFEEAHAPICLNLVLANATVQRDKSAAYPANLSVTLQNDRLRVVNGAWGPAPLSAATLANAGCAMELISDVTGGGADGRLGLDQVFCGLVNNVAIRNVNFLYRDTTAAPPTDHRHRLVAVANPGDATGSIFMPGDPAPAPHVLPLLDSGLTPHGVGADTALMTRSAADPSTRANRPVGIRFTTRCIDSPGTPAPRTHFSNASAVMNGIDYQYRFVAAFCFWTNRSKARGQSGDMADRVYSVLRMFTWEIRGVWTVVWPAGSPATLTPTTPHTISISGPSTKSPLEDAASNTVEVRPPSGVAAGLSWNAQN